MRREVSINYINYENVNERLGRARARWFYLFIGCPAVRRLRLTLEYFTHLYSHSCALRGDKPRPENEATEALNEEDPRVFHLRRSWDCLFIALPLLLIIFLGALLRYGGFHPHSFSSSHFRHGWDEIYYTWGALFTVAIKFTIKLYHGNQFTFNIHSHTSSPTVES